MFARPRNTALACLLFAAVAGYFVTGHYLYKVPIGLDESAFLLGEPLQALAARMAPNLHNAVSGVILLALSLLAIAAVGFFAMRRSVRARAARIDAGRRSFLTGAGSGAGIALGSLVIAGGAGAARGLLGVGLGHGGWLAVGGNIASDDGIVKTSPDWKQEWKGARVKGYRRLGRTGWNVSDIVLGTGKIKGEDGEQIARLAIERGVNYFDTAPDYSGSGSEQAMGRAIRGVRDKLFIATKFCTPTGHLPPGTPVAKYMDAVEASLGRLGTDYVDLCHIHSCDEVERLMDPNVHEAFDRLKQQGKVRFLGFSTHTPNLVQVANTADRLRPLRRDDARLPPRPVGAASRDHGPRAPRAGHGRRRDEDAEGRQAQRADRLPRGGGRLLAGRAQVGALEPRRLLRGDLVLRAPARGRVPVRLGPEADGRRGRHPREVRRADRAAPTARRTAVSAWTAVPSSSRSTTCCATACTSRTTAGRRKACGSTRKLEKNASVCASCSAPCLGSCPLEIRIQERMIGAHEMLTLS